MSPPSRHLADREYKWELAGTVWYYADNTFKDFVRSQLLAILKLFVMRDVKTDISRLTKNTVHNIMATGTDPCCPQISTWIRSLLSAKWDCQ